MTDNNKDQPIELVQILADLARTYDRAQALVTEMESKEKPSQMHKLRLRLAKNELRATARMIENSGLGEAISIDEILELQKSLKQSLSSIKG